MENVESQARVDREDELRQVVTSKRRRALTVDDLESGVTTGAAELPNFQEDRDSDVNSADEDVQPRRRSSVERRQRRKLSSSRCVRGLLALCVYGGLVMHQPSSDAFLNAATLPQSVDTPKTSLDNSATTSRDLEKETKALRKAALPKFQKPHATTTASATAIKKAKYHSTIPPNAMNGVTHANGTTTHWHRIPPTIYHKKQRPILSHAHSYQLHQAPLVFGREESHSFFGSADDESKGSSSFSSYMIWLSLIGLLVDTSYREWQHYRFQQLRAGTPAQRRQRHHRRSPSPSTSRRRSDSY